MRDEVKGGNLRFSSEAASLEAASLEASPLAALARDHLGLLETIFDRMPMGVALLGRDLRFYQFNRTWESFVGRYGDFGVPLVPGAYYFDVVAGSEADVMPLFERLLNGETLDLQAYPLTTSNGVTSYWNVVLAPLIDDDEVVGILNVTIDVTERIKAERELKDRIAFDTVVTTLAMEFINLPAGEIEPQIERALRIVGQVTEVDRSYIFLYRDHHTVMDCILEWCAPGVDPQISHLQNIPTADLAWSNAQLVQGDVLHIPCVAALPPEAEAERREFQSQHIQSLLAVPMIRQGEVMGLLGFDAVRAQKAWSDQNITLLQILGEIFVNALERKRSQDALDDAYWTLERRVETRTYEIERRRRVAEKLRDILTVLNSNRSLEDVLDYIVREAAALLGAQAGLLIEFDEQQQRVVFNADWGMPPDLVAFDAAPLADSKGKQAIFDRSPIGVVDFPAYVEELLSDPEEHRLTEMDYWWFGRLVEHFQSLLAAPVVMRGQLYGSLVLYYAEPREFSDEDKHLLMSLADQSSLAIENARLRVQAELAAVAEERNRIARELHDSVSQALYGIGLGVRTARKLMDRSDLDGSVASKLAKPLDYVLSLADAGLAEMRALIFELRPDALESEGLVSALKRHAAVMRTRHNLAVEPDLCDEPDVSVEVKEALYRIAQEALNNAVKHARARKVCIRLAIEDAVLVLEIGDDGAGFDASRDYPGHMGLASMRERAERHGGSLEIKSAPGAGTMIRARLPSLH